MARGYSKEARVRAALSRKIKSRMGETAWLNWKKTGVVPAGLENAKPRSKQGSQAKKPRPKSQEAAGAAAALNRADEILKRAANKPKLKDPEIPDKPPIDPQTLKLAQVMPSLHDLTLLKALAKRPTKPERSQLRQLAEYRAEADLSDEDLIKHFQDTGVFVRRGLPPESVRNFRDAWRRGESVPLYFAPKGTPVAVYRSDSADVPDLVGKVVDHFERVPEGLTLRIPYIRFESDEGDIYEYPALLGGGSSGPHVRHPAFAAIDPIYRNLEFIPSLGWAFPNFYTGDGAGESGTMENIDDLARNIQRASNYAKVVEERKAAKAKAETEGE